MKHDTSKPRKPNKNKASKRRLRNKRRKLQKQMQRQQEQCQGHEEQPELKKEVEPQPQQQKEQQEQPHHEPHPKPSADAKTPEQRTLEAQQVWQKTYENAIKWMCSHQVQYWRQRAEHLEHENEMLKAELYGEDEVPQTDEEYITSSSSSSDAESEAPADEVHESDTEVDEGYLKFLEVTRRHREELRKTREQEAKQLKNEL